MGRLSALLVVVMMPAALALAAEGRFRVAYATYLGGAHWEEAREIIVYPDGSALVGAHVCSSGLPTTPGCFQPKFAGGVDMLLAKLSPDLKKLLWCTYVGGSRDKSPRGGLALAKDDSMVVVGTSPSPDFPTTPGVIQPNLKGPRDSVVLKLKPDGSAVVFSTFLGGTGEDDAIMGARLDAAGNIYVAGHTKSADFSVTPDAPQPKLGGQSDCYLAKLSPDASRILYTTYLGGQGNEFAEHRPWLTPDGCFILVGPTLSADFPTTPDALQPKLGGKHDAFIVKLVPAR